MKILLGYAFDFCRNIKELFVIAVDAVAYVVDDALAYLGGDDDDDGSAAES